MDGAVDSLDSECAFLVRHLLRGGEKYYRGQIIQDWPLSMISVKVSNNADSSKSVHMDAYAGRLTKQARTSAAV